MVPLAELLDALRLDAPTDADRRTLVRLEAAAIAFCERRTGEYFGPTMVQTDRFPAAGAGGVVLTFRPTGPLDAVSLGGSALQLGDFAVYGRVLRRADAGLLVPELGPLGATLDVAYPVGYAVTEAADEEAGRPIADVAAPADVRQAVTLLVAHWFENRVPVALGTVAPDVALTVNDLLAPWTRLM